MAFWTKKFPCPAIPLSRYKKILVPLSLCPGTRVAAKILWQTPLFRNFPGWKNVNFLNSFLPSVPWLSRDNPGRDKTGWQNPVPACPVAKYQNPVLSHVPSWFLTGCPGRSCPVTRFWASPTALSLCPGTMKELLSLLSRKVALSRPVGNPDLYPFLGNSTTHITF